MSSLLFILNVLATLCFARNSLELGDEGRQLVRRLDEQATGFIDSISQQSVRGALGGLTLFVGVIALESLVCVVIDLYVPIGNEVWRYYWRTLFLCSVVGGIAISWITRPQLFNQPMLGFSIWAPLAIFMLPVLDLLTGTSEAQRALEPVTRLYQLAGISLPSSAWVYAAGMAAPLILLYLSVWFAMTLAAWVIVTPIVAIAWISIKTAKWSNRYFPRNGLTPLCFLLMVASAAYSWSW
jgi:hypothetical protein